MTDHMLTQTDTGALCSCGKTFEGSTPGGVNMARGRAVIHARSIDNAEQVREKHRKAKLLNRRAELAALTRLRTAHAAEYRRLIEEEKDKLGIPMRRRSASAPLPARSSVPATPEPEPMPAPVVPPSALGQDDPDPMARPTRRVA